jgi:hypothetical protein
MAPRLLAGASGSALKGWKENFYPRTSNRVPCWRGPPRVCRGSKSIRSFTECPSHPYSRIGQKRRTSIRDQGAVPHHASSATQSKDGRRLGRVALPNPCNTWRQAGPGALPDASIHNSTANPFRWRKKSSSVRRSQDASSSAFIWRRCFDGRRLTQDVSARGL